MMIDSEAKPGTFSDRTGQRSSSQESSVGYLRVSALDQKEVRQLDGLELDKRFTDHVSSRDRNRPGLDRIIEFVWKTIRSSVTLWTGSPGILKIFGSL